MSYQFDNYGQAIRYFLRSLFGSRAAEQLENELLRCRNDYESRLHDKDVTIADLRAELAQSRLKNELYEGVLIPIKTGISLGPKQQPTFVPTIEPPDPNSWAAIKARHYAQEFEEPTNGISHQAGGQEEQQVPV